MKTGEAIVEPIHFSHALPPSHFAYIDEQSLLVVGCTKDNQYSICMFDIINAEGALVLQKRIPKVASPFIEIRGPEAKGHIVDLKWFKFFDDKYYLVVAFERKIEIMLISLEESWFEL